MRVIVEKPLGQVGHGTPAKRVPLRIGFGVVISSNNLERGGIGVALNGIGLVHGYKHPVVRSCRDHLKFAIPRLEDQCSSLVGA